MIKRVGILVSDDAQIFHWQQRIIEGITVNEHFEIVFLLMDDPVKKFSSRGNETFSLATSVLNFQTFIEKKLLGIPNKGIRISDFINTHHQNCSSIRLSSIHDCDSNKIGFEIILNLSEFLVKNDYDHISRQGVWNLMFTDIKKKKRGPIGFWEVLEQREGIGASLVRYFDNDDLQITEIASCYLNRAWSITETHKIVTEGSVSMVLKELNLLINQENKKSLKPISNCPNHGLPGFWNVLRYLSRFYVQLGTKALEKLGNRTLGIRPEKWSLFLGKGDFDGAQLNEMQPVPMPKDEFWADPFLFEHKGNDYVFFENYSYVTQRGKISCGIIKGNTLVDIRDVLIKDYHLSFPFIFREGEDIFLMPETSGNKRLELYRATEFPVTWELYATAFEGEMVADPFFYTDEDNQRWLFANKQMDEAAPMNSELYIYKVESLKLDKMVSHTMNPVLIDSRIARNGGSIFKKDGMIFRPSQRNADGIYGRALNINQIKKLSLEQYAEEVISVYHPTFAKNLMAMHHLHQNEKAFVLDAAFKNSLKVSS